MSNVKVCVRFRPLSSRERRICGDDICFDRLDEESFVFKDEKGEDTTFCFDRVFYQDAKQRDLYEFLAMSIVQDTVNGINGTIITYGQTGAGKTYSLEGPGILEFDECRKGLLPRVIDGLFECLKSSTDMSAHTIKISMVEIYMERVRDLLDVSKDNLQIREGKGQGIYLSGATEVSISDLTEAIALINRGIANKAVGSTQMNVTSSRSHCLYTLSVQYESAVDGKVKSGKLMLVDLAGSEKVEKTGAEGKVLEEAKTINKSLSALGNVINALTTGKRSHIPYRSSKLTRILEDSLGGNSRTALLCCCSPSSSNTLESMSTLRFGTRAKLIKPQRQEEIFEEVSNGISQEEDLVDADLSTAQGTIPQLEIQQVILDPVSLHQTFKELRNEMIRMNEALRGILQTQRRTLETGRTTLQWLQGINSAAFIVCIFVILNMAKVFLLH
ncbi:uncharacterized protein A4U43_C07F27420 [Asparagus officinalis]|uniref:Kinesin-like protein n=1 Tax=Asparagus officinalis TaxID=4686 RepID=A0A5P1EFA0_ASPOF|nr:kinesin-like protein KIN-1 isoform X2 [Asparagus officinalis]ONK64565.1 uncharacterized protein A4U43_C07F27420 [Asparagus officinalis]